MSMTTKLLVMVEQDGWREVLANLHNVAKGMGREDIAGPIGSLVDEMVIKELADEHEDACCEDDGEAAYGREE